MAKVKYYSDKELVFEEKPKNGNFQDLTGLKFGRWIVLGFAGNYQWFCRCDCGTTKKVESGSLKKGTTKSCGCFLKERLNEIKTTHGHSINSITSKTYNTWASMLARCQNPNNKCFYNYGGRGIKVCKRWQVFENFLSDMGESPEGLTLDRIENDKGYYKENCRWVDRFVQANNKRNNKYITFNGKTKTLAQWARETGINRISIYKRLRLGWSIEQALTIPPFYKKKFGASVCF